MGEASISRATTQEDKGDQGVLDVDMNIVDWAPAHQCPTSPRGSGLETSMKAHGFTGVFLQSSRI